MIDSKNLYIWCNQSVDVHFPPHFELVYKRYLIQNGVRTRLFAFKKNAKVAMEENESTILVKKSRSLIGKLFAVLRLTWLLIVRLSKSDNRVDAVLVHNDVIAGLTLLFACRFFSVRFIYRVTHLIPEDLASQRGIINELSGSVGKLFRNYLLKKSSANIFMSERMANFLNVRDQDVVLPSTVCQGNSSVSTDCTAIHSTGEVLSYLSRSELKLIYIGNLDDSRGLLKMVDVVEYISDVHNINIKLAVLGVESRPGQAEALSNYAQERGVGELVKCFNPLPYNSLSSIFSVCDVGLCLFPSNPILDCNSPIKTMDYIYHLLPVVVTNNPDSIYVVESSKGGVIAKPSTKSIADSVLLAKSMKGTSTMLSARSWIETHRSCQTAASIITELLRRSVT